MGADLILNPPTCDYDKRMKELIEIIEKYIEKHGKEKIENYLEELKTNFS